MNVLSPKNAIPAYTSISEPNPNQRLTSIVDQPTQPTRKGSIAKRLWAWTDENYESWKRAGARTSW